LTGQNTNAVKIRAVDFAVKIIISVVVTLFRRCAEELTVWIFTVDFAIAVVIEIVVADFFKTDGKIDAVRIFTVHQSVIVIVKTICAIFQFGLAIIEQNIAFV
jgi:hypothetical protein